MVREANTNSFFSSEDNGKYYRGLSFSNPKNYRTFLDLYSNWQNQIKDYDNEQSCCNELLNIYNSANNSEQSTMTGSVESEENKLRGKKGIFLKTDSELQALLGCDNISNQIAGDHPNLKDGVWFGRPPRTLGT